MELIMYSDIMLVGVRYLARGDVYGSGAGHSH